MTDQEATLTMQDIAVLAGVQRAVVSAWRARPTVRGRSIPFPEPIDGLDGPVRFRRHEIVEYLQATGRGKNNEVQLDAPAWSTPHGASLEDLVTLLCLRCGTGEELSEFDHEDLVDLAEESDPDDRCLLREVRAMIAVKASAPYIDDLSEASRGAAEALDRLERTRTARAQPTRAFTDTALDLVRTVALACARSLAPVGVPLVHAGGSHQLPLALGAEFAELVVPEADHADPNAHRALLRRAMIRGVETSTHETALPSVHLQSLVDSDAASMFTDIEYAMDGLGTDAVALILGPASLLCDALTGEAEKERARVLRPAKVAFAARLPRGLWKQAHRQALALWVCTGRTGVPLRITDIATHDDLVPDDLASDIVAALNDDTARAFHYARLHDLKAVLGKQPVVPRGTRAVQMVTTGPVDHRDRVVAATQRTTDPIPGFDVDIAAASTHIAVDWWSLGRLENRKLLTIKRGKRYDHDEHDPHGTVDVVDATGPTGIHLDPIEAAQHYPYATRTEPGDVVFRSEPKKAPSAWVDPVGGSLLRAPARLIRLFPGAKIGPHTMAAIINRLPETAGDPLSWNVPRVAHGVQDLDDVLAAATDYEARLRERLDAVRDLTGSMINAAVEGAITVVGRREH